MSVQTLTRPGCPAWCDGSAHQPIDGFPADLLLHTQESLDAAVSLDGDPTWLRLGLTRMDDGRPGVTQIGMALNDGWLAAGCSYDEELRMTPGQARELAAVLIRLADQGEGR